MDLRRATALAVVLAFCLGTARMVWAQQGPVDTLLVLAADGSGSIDDDEFRLQRDGYAEAITSRQVLEAIAGGYHGAIAIAYVEWGGPFSQHTVVDWQVVRDFETAARFAARLRAAPRMATGYNSISGAIDYAAELIRTAPVRGEQAVIDVSGDGPQIGGRSVHLARDEAVIAGITINALAISRPGGRSFRGPAGMTLEDHYRLDVVGGLGAFVMTADEKISFADAIRNKMVLEIARAASAARLAAAR